MGPWMATIGGARRTILRAPDNGLQLAQVSIDHALHQLLEAEPRLPTEPLARLARIPDARGPLGRPHEPGVYAHVALGLQADVGKRRLDEFGHRVAHSAREHVV